MIPWFCSIISSVIPILDFLAYVICFPVVSFWGEQMKPKEKKKTNRSQNCNSTTATTLQIQTRTGLKIINGLQRNFCTTSAHLKRMPAQKEQTQNSGRNIQAEQNPCALETGAHLNLQLLSKICKPATQDSLCPEEWDSSKQDQQTCRLFTSNCKETQPRLLEVPCATQFWMHTTGNRRKKNSCFLIQIRNLEHFTVISKVPFYHSSLP